MHITSEQKAQDFFSQKYNINLAQTYKSQFTMKFLNRQLAL